MAAFLLNLRVKIEPTFVVCGKFDGSHACLVAATSAGNILIHNPHRQLTLSNLNSFENNVEKRIKWNGELAEFSIGEKILSLCTGRLVEDERDILLIGTQTHILAYQVEENADLFYKNMPHGVYSITTGKIGSLPHEVTIIGSNCSVTILDSHGNEIFWTIIGDVVKSIIIIDFDGDGKNEILVGSENCDIKVLKESSILWENKETAAITSLTKLVDQQFAYAVVNGTVGVYDGSQRLWRIKSKHKAVAVESYDVNGDGVLELITGWSSGKIDARSSTNGDIIFKIQIGNGIAGITKADYRRIGKPDLMIVSVIGEVRGYATGLLVNAPEPSEKIKKLLTRKQALIKKFHQQSITCQNYLSSKLAINMIANQESVNIAFASGPGLFIYCAIAFAEGVFDGETLVVYPQKPTEELEIELKPEKDTAVDIHIKVCVGAETTDLFQVFEIVRQLPKFCMYEIISRPDSLTEEFKNSCVIFEIPERLQRVVLWLNQNFLFSEEIDITGDSSRTSCIEIWLRGMRDNKIHCIRANSVGKSSIQTESLQFAGDIIESLTMYLGIQELGSEAKFPAEEQKLVTALERIKSFREADTRLQTDIVGMSMLLKTLIIRIEDARVLDDIDEMKKRYLQLNKLNNDLMRENEIRANNYEELVKTLKELNIGIRKASRLRGHTSMNTITKCRAAIEEENAAALIQAIQNG